MDLSINKIRIIMKNIYTKSYNRVDDSFDLILSFNANGNDDNIVKKYKYGAKTEEITSGMIKLVKEKFMSNNYDSYSLNHNVVVIEKFEETEEKIIAFLKKVNDKIRDFKDYKKMSYFEMANTMDNLSSNL